MQCFVGSVFSFPRWICMWLSYSTSLRKAHSGEKSSCNLEQLKLKKKSGLKHPFCSHRTLRLSHPESVVLSLLKGHPIWISFEAQQIRNVFILHSLAPGAIHHHPSPHRTYRGVSAWISISMPCLKMDLKYPTMAGLVGGDHASPLCYIHGCSLYFKSLC